MRRVIFVMGLLLLASLSATAQKVDVFGGYSYVHFDAGGASANFNGGVGSVAYNVNKYIAGVGEVAVYHASPAGVGVTAVTYLFGPKVYVRVGKFTPFAQVLFGGIHTSGGSVSENDFAVTYGGGVDYNLNHHFAVRLGQVEDLHTQIGSGSQDSFRYSTGVVFKL